MKRITRRQKNAHLPREPATLQDLFIPKDWTTTGPPDEITFLIQYSGADSEHHMLVFATEQEPAHLCRSQTLFLDGTHLSAPGLFAQLYPLGDTAVSCVYAFIPGRSQEIYEELFSAVSRKCEELELFCDPTTFMTDFEQAAIRCISGVFADHVSHRGCVNHLTQNTWRKIQELGLVELYKNDEDVKLFCGMLDGLASLPVDEVSHGMGFLKVKVPGGLEELVTYFDKTYVIGHIAESRTCR